MKNKAAQELQKKSWKSQKKNIKDISAHFRKLNLMRKNINLTKLTDENKSVTT